MEASLKGVVAAVVVYAVVFDVVVVTFAVVAVVFDVVVVTFVVVVVAVVAAIGAHYFSTHLVSSSRKLKRCNVNNNL